MNPTPFAFLVSPSSDWAFVWTGIYLFPSPSLSCYLFDSLLIYLVPSLIFDLYLNRHDEIQTFSPENFWSLSPTVEHEGRPVRLDWERGRVFNHEVALFFESSLKNCKSAK